MLFLGNRLKRRTIGKMMGVGWDFFSSQEYFLHPLPLQVRCTIFFFQIIYFFWGGGQGIFYCPNLNLDTRHNLITGFKQIFFHLSQSRLNYCQNYTAEET